MDSDKKSTTELRIPRCTVPSEHWEKHDFSGYNLCTYKEGEDCTYREDALGLKVCTFGKEDLD